MSATPAPGRCLALQLRVGRCIQDLELKVGMLPLILTVLNWEYSTPMLESLVRTVSTKAKHPKIKGFKGKSHCKSSCSLQVEVHGVPTSVVRLWGFGLTPPKDPPQFWGSSWAGFARHRGSAE